MPDFYLVSTELRDAYERRGCRLVRRLRSELRDDLALVEIDPPLPRHVYDTEEDVRWLVLGSRLENMSLFQLGGWPVPVYVCRLKVKGPPEGEAIASEDLTIIDWGEVWDDAHTK